MGDWLGCGGGGGGEPSATLSSPTHRQGLKVRADQMSSGNRVSTYAQTIAVQIIAELGAALAD